jgi:aquaporin Z
MRDAVRAHWPEYLMEGAGLGLFMISACAFGTLLGHPASPVVRHIPDALERRLLMGVAMGLTAIALIYSPWGRRSGAHLNPATTFTFWRLGKVASVDAGAYAMAQVVGGVIGVLIAAAVLGSRLADESVSYVVTIPGSRGHAPAFVAEVLMTFGLMSAVLRISNEPRWARWTGVVAGTLVAVYITVEAPLSGMSMNPARSLASATVAQVWDGLWIYFTAPPLGMLLAAEAYVRRRGRARVFCAKLDHDPRTRCIFACRYSELAHATRPPAHMPIVPSPLP